MPEFHAEKTLRDSGWDGSIPVCLAPILRYLNLEWEFAHIKGKAITIATKNNRLIIINSDLPMTAKRFKCAHEIGHWVLHNPEVRSGRVLSPFAEYDANSFAGALLCPTIPFCETLHWMHMGLYSPTDVCNMFCVSRSVVEIRSEKFF